jgi:hypothetical protein
LNQWSAIPEVPESDSKALFELPDQGMCDVIARCAGPEFARKVRDDIGRHRTRVIVRPEGVRPGTFTSMPRSEEDQNVIEEASADYLAGAGVPPRPSGWRWFLVPLADGGDAVQELTRVAIRAQSVSVDPRHIRRAIEAAIPQVYATGDSGNRGRG